MALGKPRSFRLSSENVARLEQLEEFLKLDNPNLTLNRVIQDYHAYLKYRHLITALEELFQLKAAGHP